MPRHNIVIITSVLSLLFLVMGIFGIVDFADAKFYEPGVSDENLTTSEPTESDLNIAVVRIPEGSTEDNSIDFDPATLKIGKGTTVKWINEDDAVHTVISGTPGGNNSGSNRVGSKFDSSELSPNYSYRHTFEKTGTYKYFDELHTYMRGKIVVSSESTPVIETAEKETSVSIDTFPNLNVNVSNWSNFTDSENRFSIEYPTHWSITQSGNRFTKELPFVAVDANGSSLKIQSQVSVNAFKSSKNFDSNDLAKFAYDQLVKQSSGSKLVEPISCNEYTIDREKACSFLYAGDDKEGKRYGILAVAFVDENKINHLISYRADPSNFDKDTPTMERIVNSYKIMLN